MKIRRSLDYDGLDGILPSKAQVESTTVWYLSPWVLVVICTILMSLLFFQDISQVPSEITEADPPQAGNPIPHSALDVAASTQPVTLNNKETEENVNRTDPTRSKPDDETQESAPLQTQSLNESNRSNAAPLFTVHFKFDSNALSLLSSKETRELLRLAKSCYKQIKLIGHTCDLGDTTNNQILGLARAKAVEEFLVSNGTSRQRIVTESEGERHPIASNDTRTGRAENRRTELFCLN